MGRWMNLAVAWAALCVTVTHANTKTAGQKTQMFTPVIPAPPDSGKACSCSGVVSRSLDCSNRGRSAISAKDLCTGRTTAINLSQNSFVTFPGSLGSYIVEVNISRNQLTALPRSPPLNSKTTLLDVSDNRISQSSNELKSLASLKTLVVAGNRFQMLSFLPEPCALKHLRAQNNAIHSLEGPLRSCSKLEILDLSNNQLNSLPRGAFSGLRELEQLKLIRCRLVNLAGGAFEGLQELEILDLTTNGLSSLPPGIFSPLKNLEMLYLDGNNIANLPVDCFTGLQKITWISLNENKLIQLPRGAFNNLKNVKKIYLNDNQLRSLPEGIFSGLQKLENVGLRVNQLGTLPSRLFAGLRSLKGVLLSQNVLTALPSDLFSGVTSLELIDLHSNRLTSLPPGLFQGIKSVKTIDLSNNRFTTFSGRDFTGLKSITRLDLVNNQITSLPAYDDTFPEISMTYLDNNKIVDVSETVLRSWLGEKTKLLSLGSSPLLRSPASLGWATRDKKITTSVSSNCMCGGLKRGKAEVHFCVAVTCPRSSASWVEAAQASSAHLVKGRRRRSENDNDRIYSVDM